MKNKYMSYLSNKKGAGRMAIGVLVSILLLAVLMTAIGPEIFSNDNITGAPTWVNTILPIIFGAGFVTMAWRAFK